MKKYKSFQFVLGLALAMIGWLPAAAVADKPTLVMPLTDKALDSQPTLQIPALDKTDTDKPTLKAQVNLLASRSAISPSKSIELAITFEIAEGWHTYWRNHGEGGLGPSFKWNLPTGFTVGELQFPAPTRYVDAVGDHSFILEGNPVLLTTLTAPKDLPLGQDVAIGVDATWLVCEKACIKESKQLELTLPVVADSSQVKPINEDTFKYARTDLPMPQAKAKYLQNLSAVASVDKVGPGAKFKVAVVLDVAKGYHLNSHKPLSEYLIPTDVFNDTTDDLIFCRAKFPEGKIEESPLGKVSLYTARTIVTIPVEADAVLQTKQLRIRGVVTYQACSDKTLQCYRPTAADWELILPVAEPGEAITAVNTDLFTSATPTTGGFNLDADIKPTSQAKEHSLLVWLVLAFLAGLLLNVTPCVLPVISIKILSFVQQASESPAKLLKLGLAFSLGMLIVFNVLAVLATGLGMAWGQHFQTPAFSIAMAAIVFAFTLSLFGVFTLGVPTSVGSLSTQADGEGYTASIAKGMFATIMGTPCVGPFLGPVLVWSASQSVGTVFLVFNTIGLGMTLPYALLTANPKWLRFIPKAGPWLTIFKQVMAFVLLAIVVHLLNIVQAQLGGDALVATLMFLTAVAVGCWIIGTWLTPSRSSGGRVLTYVVAVAVVLLGGWYSFSNGFEPREQVTVATRPSTEPGDTELPWIKDFSLDKLNELTAIGKTVLLDITAKWCTVCKVNSKFVFNTPEMRETVQKYDVIPLLGDFTSNDPEIEKLIGRLAPGSSVPFCAIFPANRPNEPHVLLGKLTKDQVITAIEQASAKPTNSQ